MKFLDKDVFTKRHDVIRSFLEKEGYEAFLVLTQDNFYYVSGYFLDVAPWERPVVACIPRKGEPFLIMNELSTNHIRLAKERGTLAITDTHIWQEHISTVHRSFTKLQWTGLLARELKKRGIDRGTLATDAGYGALLPLTGDLPKIAFNVESELLKEMRMYKSHEELELVREGGKFSDYGQGVWRDLTRPGRYMAEVDAEARRIMLAHAAKAYPGNKVDVYWMSLSGPYSASPHGTGGDIDMTIERGHVIVNIQIVTMNGYVTENERTWIVGEPSDIQRRAFEAATKACQAASAQMVAGNPVSSIDAAALAVTEAAGFGQYVNCRTGHGIGIAGHEFPEDVAFNHRPLRAGEVWSAEPGIYIPGVGGFRHDDTVIVGEREPEIVTKYPKNLEDQIIQA